MGSASARRVSRPTLTRSFYIDADNCRTYAANDQSFTYDPSGNIRSNSALGTYTYPLPTANRPHAPTAVTGQAFAYDANGNMTAGLDGKVMAYDAENRPLSVRVPIGNGLFNETRYTYAADGTRLKMISNFGTPTASTTLYLGPLEVQNFGGVTTDDTYIDSPHPQVRVVNGVVSYLHQDERGSVILITDAAGAKAREVAYRPYGEILYNGNFLPAVPGEARGFIGERYDAGAGLQYLNARYYDPRLGMFLQPDWFEVTEAGVGTNRYAYAGGDPVNGMDPGGNNWLESVGNWVVNALRGGSQAALTGIATDISIPEPTDVAPQKWVAYAVVGSLATGIVYATNGNQDDKTVTSGIGHNGGPPMDNNEDPGQGGGPNRPSALEAALMIAAGVSTANLDFGQSAEPRDLNEEYVFALIRAAPGQGVPLNLSGDNRFPTSLGFQKMQYTHRGLDGTTITLHYQTNRIVGGVFDLKVVYNSGVMNP